MSNISDSRPKGKNSPVNFIDYRANENLSGMQVSFHWWDSERTTLHYHNYCEFFIITSGRTYHILNGVREVLEKNTMLLIRPQDVHQFVSYENEKCVHINISATPERFSRLCLALGITDGQVFGDGGTPTRAKLTGDELEYFMSRAQQVNFLSRNENERRALQLTISEMLIQGIALIYKRRLIPHDGRPQWLSDLLERLHSPEFMSCSADDVYRLAGYSAPVVIRSFKHYTGETVRSYLVRLKLDWAVLLFRTTSLSVLEVAESLGYSSLSHFGKLFARHAGMCPREFKARQTERTADVQSR